MLSEIRLISSRELARSLGYCEPNAAFYEFCRNMGILSVPGRRGWYDPKLVRMKLDLVQGLSAAIAGVDDECDLVEVRRARIAAT
ncbi:hypothetical protein SAMN04488030_1816 [Aliiroseovarius halocynthiae]|nr:hypothetical protein SAMN04488030_1816 [Aliiroseovarius halocynthiae]